MLSKRYIPNQLESLNNEENLTKHYRKLEEIQKEDRKRKNVDKEVAEKAKFTESREKAIKFHISERTNAIEKDNELLLGRLVEISRKKPGVLGQVKSEANLPRTLNGPSRKREKNRIAAENEAFARRLLSQQPSFNPKKLESDYEKHHQRVRNMAKIATFSPRKVRLPPIKYADFDNSNKNGSKSVKNKKPKKIDYEGDNQPKSMSPVKATKAKDDAPATKPVVTDSHKSPVEHKPVEHKPVEQKPVEQKPVEQKPVEPKPVETKPVEDKPVEHKPVEENKPVEQKPAEQKPVEQKPVEQKPVEQKPVEQKPVEQKPAESKPVETKPVENKPVENKPASQDNLNKPAEDQKQASVVNVDNKQQSQVLADNLPKSGVVADQPKSGVVADQPKSGVVADQPKSGVVADQPKSGVVADQKQPEDKPVEEEIKDESKEPTA